MQRVVTNEEGFAKLFITIQGPRRPQSFAEVFFVFLEPGLRQVVLAVDGEFQSEEIEDGRDEVLSLFQWQTADERKAVPGRISRPAIEVDIGSDPVFRITNC